MHQSILESLRCPVCSGALRERREAERHEAERGTRALRCPNGHSFDLARQGYVDLSGGRITHAGDGPDMVAARATLLATGHLDRVTSAIGDAVRDHTTDCGLIVDIGAGTGHHLARTLNVIPQSHGLAVDVSKPALRRAARAHPRIGAIRADVWRGLPLADRTASAILDVFAPRSAAEFHRIIRPDGVLVVASAEPDHLAELIAPLGLIRVDPAKHERLASTLSPGFTQIGARIVNATLALTREHAEALVGMGPSAWHTDPAAVRRQLAGMASTTDPITVTLAVGVSAWRPRPMWTDRPLPSLAAGRETGR